MLPVSITWFLLNRAYLLAIRRFVGKKILIAILTLGTPHHREQYFDPSGSWPGRYTAVQQNYQTPPAIPP
jgi:hypothetical protein